MAMESSFVSDNLPIGDFEKLTVSSTVKTFTATKIAVAIPVGWHKRAVKAFITVETDAIRVRFDGTAPDSSTGHLIASGTSFTITGEQNIANTKMIRVTNDATIQVSYSFNQ